jgi:hypothetical protein
MHIRLLILPLCLFATAAGQAPSERRFMLTDFERIRVDGPFRVEVTTGLPAGASVSGDSRASGRVDLRVDGGILVVAPSSSGWDGWKESGGEQLVIRVKARALHGARVNGGGALTVDRMAGARIDLGVNGSGRLTVGSVSGDQLVATLSGSGTLTLSGGSVQRARFLTAGAGSVDAAGASASELVVQSQSSGDSRYHARLTAGVASLGSGTVRVEGPAVCRLSGTGPSSCAGKMERR